MGSYDFSAAREFARTGRSTPVEQTVLFWAERGDASAGRTALFLHGIPTWSYLWRNVIGETGLTHRSIALDLPGFGLSDKSPRHSFRVSDLAQTLERFLDEIDAGDGVDLVVHDFGALVGAELLARNRSRYRKLVITNTSLRRRAWSGAGPLSILGVPYLGDLSMALARPWMLRAAMYPFVADPKAQTPERVAGYWYPFEAGFGSALARLFRERAFDAADFDRWRSTLNEFDGHVLIAWGARDPAFTTRDVADLMELMPNAELTEFENASHFLPEERPHALGRRIRTFLNEVSS